MRVLALLQVAIDAHGLFKVTHMLNMASPTSATATAASDMLESQVGLHHSCETRL